MKILNIINLIGILLNPITLDRYRNSTNNTGNPDYNNFVQCTYLYTVDNPSNEIEVSMAGWVGTTYEMPQVYKFTLKINFREPVHNATLLLTFTTPDTYSYSYNYIAENCFVTGTYGNITVTAYNTDFCIIEFYFSGHMLVEMYDYPISAVTTWSLDPTENIWVENGYNYFDLLSVRLDSVSLEPTQNYNTELNSLILNTDGIEGILNAILNNTSYMNTISSNINAINSATQIIQNNTNDLIHNNIGWVEFTPPVSYIGYSTDAINFDNTGGYHDAGYYVIQNINFNSNYLGCIYKFQIPLGGVDYSIDDFTFYQFRNNELNQLELDNVLYFADRYKSTWYIVFNEEASTYPLSTDPILIYCSKRIYYYRNIGWDVKVLPSDNMQYWTIYGLMRENKNFSDIKDGMNDIISILAQIDIEQGTLDEKTTVDNFFQQIKQTLVYPSSPGQEELMPVLKTIVGFYKKIIDLQALRMYKWVLSVTAYTILFKVITR